MEFRLLRYFVVVAEELHFSRAAARLNMAQPPLSRQIRNLEEELGVQLFLRTRRRVELTEPGRYFLGSARELLAQADQAALQVQRVARGETGLLRIGMVSSVAFEDTLPRVVRAYRKRFPGVTVALRELSPNEQLAALKEERIQVGLMRLPLKVAMLASTPFYREPLVAVLPAEHPLASRKRIPLKALAKDPFIIVPRSQGLGGEDLVLGACLRAGFTPLVAQEALELQSVIGYVAAGFGVSLLPSASRRLAHGGVAFVTLAPPVEQVEMASVYLAGNQSPLLAGFLAVLKETVREP